MNKAISVRLMLAALLIGGIALYFLSTRTGPHLPQSIGGLKLEKEISGNEAATVINNMHGKGVTPDDNIIGMYSSDEGAAVLYLSVYSSSSKAEAALIKMNSLISLGSPIFADFRAVEIEGSTVFYCFGAGQAHYFFAYDDGVYWLAADQPIASRTASILRRSLVEH